MAKISGVGSAAKAVSAAVSKTSKNTNKSAKSVAKSSTAKSGTAKTSSGKNTKTTTKTNTAKTGKTSNTKGTKNNNAKTNAATTENSNKKTQNTSTINNAVANITAAATAVRATISAAAQNAAKPQVNGAAKNATVTTQKEPAKNTTVKNETKTNAMQQKTEAMVQNTDAMTEKTAATAATKTENTEVVKAAKVAVEKVVKATVVAAENIREMMEKVTENPPVSEQKKNENKALTSVKDASKKEEATKTSAVDRNVTGMYNIGIGSSLSGGSIGLNGVLFGGIMGPLGMGTLDSRGKIASYYTQEKTAKAGNRDYVTWKSGQKEYQVTSADLHLMLDVMGMIPVWGDLADLANAAMYLKEGNVKEAGNIVLSVITNTDNIKTLNKFRKQLNLAYETADNLEELGDGYKAAKKISKEVKGELKEEAAEKAGKKVVKEGGSKTIDDIIDNLSETTNGKGVARNFESTGGFEQTIKDFDALDPTDVKEIQTQYGLGKVGKLSDGTTVVARPGSTTGGPTLEIRVSNSKVYKIRY